MTCPPCTHDCNQGENCPARDKQLTQRTWVGLTDEEREEIHGSTKSPYLDLIVVEAKLKEKNA